MQDRNVEFPNRFRMVKVEGTDDIYDVIPAPGEVISEGDTFSKQNMLPDHIPALLGLKIGNPQVKDALNVLANIGNVYVWAKAALTDVFVPVLGAAESVTFSYPKGGWEDSIAGKFYANVDVSSGEVVLLGEQTPYSPGYISGLYYNGDDAVYYVVEYTGSASDDSSIKVYFTGQKVTVDTKKSGTVVGFPTSTDSTAYPQDGDVGDCHYTYLGQLGEPGAKIEVGSYVGTGTYGESNPSSIPIKKTTKLVIVQAANLGGLGSQGYYWMLCVRGNTASTQTYPNISSPGNYVNVLEWSEETLSWYNNYDSYYQLNSSAVTYRYLAIG